MASISLLLIGFLAVLAGLYHFNNKLQKFTGSVVVIVIALVVLYISVTFADLILSRLGFSTGFPSPEKGYYLYQAFIYILIGLVMLAVHYYLLKEISSKEVSYAFQWNGIVLLLSGGLDSLIETFIRIQLLEFRLFLAILLLIVLIFVATKYRDRFFGSKEGFENKQSTNHHKS